MPLSAWLLTGFLIGASPTAPGDQAPPIKLEKGLEITWRGSFSEAILRPGARTFRTYEIESRIFILDTFDKGSDVALYTAIKLKPDLKGAPEPPPIIRLSLLRIDMRGNASSLPSDSLTFVPDQRKPVRLQPMTLEGLPALDNALFLALPQGMLESAQKWEVAEDNRPTQRFRLDGIESVRGARTWKVVAGQQTEDWEALKIERPAWRRGESYWISTTSAWTLRFERTIEKRDPKTSDVGYRSKLLIEHVGRMTYPGRLGVDRREEITAAMLFIAEYERLARDSNRGGPEPFERLVRQIDQHIASNFTGDTLVYREPIVWIKRKADSARKGQLPPMTLPAETIESSSGLTVNRLAPDLTVPDLTNSEIIRLSKLRGKPVVLIYYQPGSTKTAEPVLRLAEGLYRTHGPKAFILPLAIGANEAALEQRNDLKLSVHVFGGREVYRTHSIESTPTFVILDEAGVVKRVVAGWSDENAETVRVELERCVK